MPDPGMGKLPHDSRKFAISTPDLLNLTARLTMIHWVTGEDAAE